MYWIEQFPDMLKFPVNGAEFLELGCQTPAVDSNLEFDVIAFDTDEDDSDVVDIHKIWDIFFCILTDATA